MKRFGVVACVLLLVPQVAPAADLANGRSQFRKCEACHSLKEGENKIGPHLHGVFGRRAGSVAGFSSSTAMKSSGIVWDETTLDQYIAAPTKMVRGTKMVFAGIARPKDRADLIAFLKDATK